MTDMRLIQNIEELSGKTILKAVLVDYESTVMLTFTDNSYCAVSAYGDMYLLDSEEDIDDAMFRDAGIITEEEYEKRERAEMTIELKYREDAEKAAYKRLKAKYGDE